MSGVLRLLRRGEGWKGLRWWLKGGDEGSGWGWMEGMKRSEFVVGGCGFWGLFLF